MAKKQSKALALPSDNRMSVPGSNSMIYNLFVPREQAAADSAEVKKKVVSMSPMLKPNNWPKDAEGKNLVLVGVFTKIFETTPAKKKVGFGIEVVPEGAPHGVAIPGTALIRSGLEISGEGKGATSPHLDKVIEVWLGEDPLPSKKGQAAWHFMIQIHEPSGSGPAKKKS